MNTWLHKGLIRWKVGKSNQDTGMQTPSDWLGLVGSSKPICEEKCFKTVVQCFPNKNIVLGAQINYKTENHEGKPIVF